MDATVYEQSPMVGVSDNIFYPSGTIAHVINNFTANIDLCLMCIVKKPVIK